jgi:hypothetical protein
MLFILIIILLILILFSKPKVNDKTEIIKTLVRQASRWSTAAIQDENPLIAILHANYGAGYLWALKDIATDNEIEKAMNIDIIKFRDEIIKIQDEVNMKAVKKCPSFSPKSSYLTKLAKEGL